MGGGRHGEDAGKDQRGLQVIDSPYHPVPPRRRTLELMCRGRLQISYGATPRCRPSHGVVAANSHRYCEGRWRTNQAIIPRDSPASVDQSDAPNRPAGARMRNYRVSDSRRSTKPEHVWYDLESPVWLTHVCCRIRVGRTDTRAMIHTKSCPACGKRLSAVAFNASARSPDGLVRSCRACGWVRWSTSSARRARKRPKPCPRRRTDIA